MASRTRASLAACTAEGLFTEVVGACAGGAAMTAWAMHLGASPIAIGALWGLPYFAHLLHLPAAWATAHFGRRRVSLAGHALSRFVLLPLAVLPFLALTRPGKLAVLFAVYGASSALGVVGHNAWLAWIVDLVPKRLRGRFFGRRTAACTLVATIASLATGSLLDRARAHGTTAGALAWLALVGWAAGTVAAVSMSRQHDPPGAPKEQLELADFVTPLVDPCSRRLVVYKLAWNASVGLTASLAAVYLVTDLRIGFAGLGLYAATVAAARIIATPLWGRAMDRVGARPLLVVSAFGSALSSVLLVFAVPGRIWPVGLEAVLSGLLLGGQELALFAIPLAVAPRTGRPIHLAAFSTAGGLAFGVASVVGGAAKQALPLLALPLGLRALFLVSSVGRLAACLAGLRVIEPRSKPIAGLASLALRSLRALGAPAPLSPDGRGKGA